MFEACCVGDIVWSASSDPLHSVAVGKRRWKTGEVPQKLPIITKYLPLNGQSAGFTRAFLYSM